MQISTRLHGLLSLALLLVTFNIVYFTLHVPARSHLAVLEERLDSIAFQLSRYRQIANSRNSVESELTRLETGTDQSDYFITASSSTLAIADLQNRLQSLIEQYHGNIISMDPQPIQSGQSFEKLMIRLQFGSNIKTLQNILHALTGHRPVFIIDELMIQSRPSHSTPTDSLNTRLVISAYRTVPPES